MPTVAHTVKKIIDTKPFLQEALLKEIINYGALADLLIPDIEKELGVEPKHAAVMMAIRRYQEKITKSPFAQRKFKPSSFSIRSDLMSITLENKKRKKPIASILREFFDSKKECFFTVSQGVTEITIIVEQRFEKELLKLLKGENILRREINLAGLSIVIPQNMLDTPGVYFQIIRMLAWENINVHEIFSTSTELVLLVSKNDVARAYNCLNC